MRTLAIVTIVTAVAAASLLAQPARVYQRPQLPSPQILARLGLKERWHTYVPVAGTKDGVAHAQVLDGDQLVIQTLMGQVVALNAETGASLWRVRLPEAVRAQRQTVDINDYLIIVVASGKVYGFDRVTGSMEWQMKLPGALSAPPSADNSRLFICTGDGRIHTYALPLPQRELERAVQGKGTRPGLTAATAGAGELDTAASSGGEPRKLWTFQTDAPVTEAPIVTPTHVVFANAQGDVYSFQRDQKALADKFHSPAPITAPIAQSGDMLFIASQDFNLYAFDLSLGRLILRWRFVTGSRVLQMPIVIGNDVFAIALDGGMFCLDRETGEARWHQLDADQFVAATQQVVYVADRHGFLIALDRSKGRILDKWDASAFALRVRNTETDRVYLAAHDGLVLCLQDAAADRGKPTYHHQQMKKEEPAPLNKSDAKPEVKEKP